MGSDSLPRHCDAPCCAKAREAREHWSDLIALYRVIVRARTGQRIHGSER